MNASCSSLLLHRARRLGQGARGPLGAALLALAACNGTAVVTMTSTASTDNFLAYRVGLVSVQLQTASGGSGLTVLPASTTVDFATLTNLNEVLGAAPVSKGTYTSAVITLDYSSAQIVYDNGSLDGLSLTPVGANGQAAGSMSSHGDSRSERFVQRLLQGRVAAGAGFQLAASNVVDLTNNTVTVTPLIAASAMPIDSKQVRIRGPCAKASTEPGHRRRPRHIRAPVHHGRHALQQHRERRGNAGHRSERRHQLRNQWQHPLGSTGLEQLAALSTGTLAVAYGTLTAADETSPRPATTADGTSTTTSPARPTVTFSATQVLAGSSVQGAGLDRVSGVVTARSGNTLELRGRHADRQRRHQ